MDLPLPWKDTLLTTLNDAAVALAGGDACTASNSVLDALEDVAAWQEESMTESRANTLEALYEELLRLRRPVLAERPVGEGCGGGASVALDTSIAPLNPSLEALDGNGERPVAAMVDSRGVQTDFVENELLLVSDSPDAGPAFAARWGGSVVDVEVDDQGQFHTLVRVGELDIDPHQLPALLASLRPGITEAVAVSSKQARNLLAVAALEAANGILVGFNPVGAGEAVADGVTSDAPVYNGNPAFGWTPDGTWSSNAFDWVHYRADSVQGIGVPQAWQFMESLGLLTPNSVTIGIVDMGFLNIDMPPGQQFLSMARHHGCPGSGRSIG